MFTGIMMLVLNTASRDILHEFSDNDEEYRRNIILRRLAIFAVCFIGTRDIIHSLLLTAAFVVMATGLYQSKSLYSREGFILTTSLADRNAAAAAARNRNTCTRPGEACRPAPPPCPAPPAAVPGGGSNVAPACTPVDAISGERVRGGTFLEKITTDYVGQCGTACCAKAGCTAYYFSQPEKECSLYSGATTTEAGNRTQYAGTVNRAGVTQTIVPQPTERTGLVGTQQAIRVDGTQQPTPGCTRPSTNSYKSWATGNIVGEFTNVLGDNDCANRCCANQDCDGFNYDMNATTCTLIKNPNGFIDGSATHTAGRVQRPTLAERQAAWDTANTARIAAARAEFDSRVRNENTELQSIYANTMMNTHGAKWYNSVPSIRPTDWFPPNRPRLVFTPPAPLTPRPTLQF